MEVFIDLLVLFVHYLLHNGLHLLHQWTHDILVRSDSLQATGVYLFWFLVFFLLDAFQSHQLLRRLAFR